MKKILLALLTIISVKAGNCQNIDDYFFPKNKESIAKFKISTNGPEQTFKYHKKDSIYECEFISSWDKFDYMKCDLYYKINKNVVYMIKYQIDDIGLERITNRLEKGEVILKMPEKNKNCEWKFKDIDDQLYNCEAEMTMIKYKNDERSTIKVICYALDKNGLKNNKGKTIKYYVLGIGYYKTEVYNEKGVLDFYQELISIK